MVGMAPIHSVGTCIVETGAWGSSRWTITKIDEYAGMPTYFVVSDGVIGHIPVVIGNDYLVCEPIAPPVEPIAPPVEPIAPPVEPYVPPVEPYVPPVEHDLMIMAPIHSVGTCIVETGAWGSSRWTITKIDEYAGMPTYFVVSDGVIGHIPVVIGNDYLVCEPIAPPVKDDTMIIVLLFAIAYIMFSNG